MQRIITAEEPERPSARLNKTALTGSASPLAARPGSLPADLDWIVMKCLEKDRARRYETASALASDLRRHLNNEPVLACPPTLGYRLHKSFRRNKTMMVAGALVVATLAVAVVVSMGQAIQAKRERQTALEQTKTARAAKDFIIEQMLAFNPFWDSQAAMSAEKRATVDRLARAVESSFVAQPLTRAEIHQALAAAYAGLGDPQNQALQSRMALKIREALLPLGHSDTLHSAGELAEAFIHLGQHIQAEELLDGWFRKIPAARTGPSFGQAWMVYQRASLLRAQGRGGDAIGLFQEAMATFDEILGRGNIRSRNMLWNLAAGTQEAGRLGEAERLWTEGTRDCERDLGSDHFMTIQFKKGLASCRLGMNEPQRAQRLLEEIIPVYHRLVGSNHNNALDTEGLLGESYAQQGRVSEAARLYEGLYPRWAKRLPYHAAQRKCRDMAKFFQQHGYFKQADAVRALLDEPAALNSATNTASFRPDHAPP